MKMEIAVGLGIRLNLLVLPLTLSILPAVTRSSVRIKGFLPEWRPAGDCIPVVRYWCS